MKIAVVGGRNFCDKDFVEEVVATLISNGDVFISGGAKGVDSWAENIVTRLNIGENDFVVEKLIYLPDWDKYGKRAGFLRNKLIIEDADMVLAFWDGKSKGTKNSIDLAIAKNIPINIYIRNNI